MYIECTLNYFIMNSLINKLRELVRGRKGGSTGLDIV